MVRAYYNQEQFNFGKLGILLRARRDASFYRSGCKTLKNFRPTVQGPAEKRKGTVYVAETKDSSVASRLIPFVFSETDSFRLEFGNLYIRFFKGYDSVFEADKTITGATQADPVVITSALHGYSNGDEIKIESVVGMTELNGKRYRLANVATNTFELQDVDGVDIDGTGFTAYSTGGIAKRIYEIVSPYSTSDLVNLKFDQIGDVMYIAAGGSSVRPQKLTRTTDISWTIANLDNQLGPVEDINTSTTTITLSGTLTKGGSSTWTSSVGIFESAHVGSVWGIAKSTDETITGYARMTGFTSSTIATFTNQHDLTPVTTVATVNWFEASWSDVRGYPNAVAFHEDRLFWAGTPSSPLDIYGSVASSYENYDTDDASADDGLRFELVGQKNTIQWLESDGDFLVSGTIGGLGFVRFDVTDTTITPKARVGSTFGASSVQGGKINNQVVYLHNSTKSLYETEYDDITLKYRSIDLNDMNPDILGSGIQYLATIEQPDVAVIMPHNNGLKFLSRDSNQKIIGWYEYDFGGDVESIATTPNTDAVDDIWMVNKRTVNAITRRYVEYIDTSSEEIYVDSSVTYDGVATRSLSGLDHLEGEVVDVWGDGAFSGTYTVTSGVINIPITKSEVEKAHIGLQYNADLEIMPIDIPIPNTGNTSQTFKGRVNEVFAILYNTLGLEVGPTFDKLKVVPFRSAGAQMNNAPQKSGEIYPEERQIPFSGDWLRSPTICFRSSGPFPCTIVSLMARMEVEFN